MELFSWSVGRSVG